jgi:hypothetical protein
MPSSIDVPMNTDYDAPMAFRRERYWFLSFMTAPFKDIDNRASEEPAREPGQRWRR